MPRCEVVIAPEELRKELSTLGREFRALEEFVGAGSIYEASAFVEELSRLRLSNGSRLSKSFVYEGYELWWINYDTLFFHYCLPYTQYRKLLEYLVDFKKIKFYKPPYNRLFSCYFQAYECEVEILREPGLRGIPTLPLGILLQVLITLIFLPVLMLQRRGILLFTSDEFDGLRDYNFRMRFIYEELRQKNLPFVEFIRSIEPWKTVLMHALKRKRAVIYTDAVTFVGRLASRVSGGRRRARQMFGNHIIPAEIDRTTRFKFLVATQYLLCVYDDIWAIQIMKWIVRAVGIKSALILAAMGRNFQTVLGCKLNGVPTIGILHGVASRHYNVYDFMPTYDGQKTLSVDKYGVWSEWWKEYYIKNGRAYNKEQLYVSGPMRPLVRGEAEALPKNDVSSSIEQYEEDEIVDQNQNRHGPIKVLFVSEQLAVPHEVIPYLEALLDEKSFSIYICFRPYLDRFEVWLKTNNPDILARFEPDKIFRSGIKEAITKCDIVVGTHSTAVLEALFELKPMVFFSTNKWGDYFNLKDSNQKNTLFAESPKELLECMRRGVEIPKSALKKHQQKFFGNLYQNGSKWMVEEAEKSL